MIVKIGDLGVAKLLETSTAFAQTIVGILKLCFNFFSLWLFLIVFVFVFLFSSDTLLNQLTPLYHEPLTI